MVTQENMHGWNKSRKITCTILFLKNCLTFIGDLFILMHCLYILCKYLMTLLGCCVVIRKLLFRCKLEEKV